MKINPLRNLNVKALIWLNSVILVSLTSAFANEYDHLTSAQQDQIQKGKVVAVFEVPPGEYWPTGKVYQRVEATPEEAAAVLFDIPKHKEFMHRVVQSDIVQTIDPTTTEVDYALGLNPILAVFIRDTRYRLITSMDYNSSNDDYLIQWNLTKSEFLEGMSGSARFEKLGTGTLVSYFNTMKPRSTHLHNGIVVSGVKRGSREALESIVERIHDEKLNQPELLRSQIEALRKALLEKSSQPN